jgi:hypothetical protein
VAFVSESNAYKPGVFIRSAGNTRETVREQFDRVCHDLDRLGFKVPRRTVENGMCAFGRELGEEEALLLGRRRQLVKKDFIFFLDGQVQTFVRFKFIRRSETYRRELYCDGRWVDMETIVTFRSPCGRPLHLDDPVQFPQRKFPFGLDMTRGDQERQ